MQRVVGLEKHNTKIACIVMSETFPTLSRGYLPSDQVGFICGNQTHCHFFNIKCSWVRQFGSDQSHRNCNFSEICLHSFTPGRRIKSKLSRRFPDVDQQVCVYVQTNLGVGMPMDICILFPKFTPTSNEEDMVENYIPIRNREGRV